MNSSHFSATSSEEDIPTTMNSLVSSQGSLNSLMWTVSSENIDHNLLGNGILDVGEFMHTIVHLFGGNEKEKIAAAFMVCDKDNSGFLDFKEVENLIFNTIRLTRKSEGDLAKIAYATTVDLFSVRTKDLENNDQTIDLNKDDKISFEEFMSWYSGSLTLEEKEGLKQIRMAKIEDLKKRGLVPLSKEVYKQGFFL